MEAIRRWALVTALAPVTWGRTAVPTGLPAPGAGAPPGTATAAGAPAVRRTAELVLPGILPARLPAADRLRRGHAPAGPR
ncbi:hypothetical protein [Nocardiopsis sp. CA-288880]|uniref:hypothetical protein n=1 Tax=Nocardiopsis sp. CA-288880 TaxID=3239995 RepID=UPI003D99FC6C